MKIEKIGEVKYRIPKEGKMRTDAIFYANERILPKIEEDKSLEQLMNVASLPGIVGNAIGMPDIHWGYGMPVGGVAAFDAESGIVSPGAVGYDINCITPDTKIITSWGAWIKAGELPEFFGDVIVFEPTWQNENSPNVNGEPGEKKGKIKASPIILKMKRKEEKEIFVLKTKFGFSLKATADHPVLTHKGMVRIDRLKPGDKVFIYPFEGVKWEKPKSKVILDEKTIVKTLKALGLKNRGNRYLQIIYFLKKKKLIPLSLDNPNLPIISKLAGIILGDGTIFFSSGKGQIHIYRSDEKDRDEIDSDIKKLGLGSVKLKGKSGIKISSTSFAVFLCALGLPHGKRTRKDFGVPWFVSELPLWMKRLFVASLFGADMSSPQVKKFSFRQPFFTIVKDKEYVKSGIRFCNELREILSEMNIKTSEPKVILSDGKYLIRFSILANEENLIRFFRVCSYEYSLRKRELANLCLAYLMFKKQVVREREIVRKKAIMMKGSVMSSTQILSAFDDLSKTSSFMFQDFVGEGFILHSVWGRSGNTRVLPHFPPFEEFVKNHSAGDGFVVDEVVQVERRKWRGWVWDITVSHSAHNFVANSIVVSNCGVRLHLTNLEIKDIKPHIEKIVNTMFDLIPAGVGLSGHIKFGKNEMKRVCEEGVKFVIELGYGSPDEIENIESEGQMKGADFSAVTEKAYERGRDQLGTVGSGNHFVELGYVAEVYRKDIAEKWGVKEGMVTLLVHSGSRGFGHQTCDDYLKIAGRWCEKNRVSLPDRQLVYMPVNSKEGESYIGAMNSAINYAFCNRLLIAHFAKKALLKALGISERELGFRLLYDVAHNTAKFEEHEIDGEKVKVIVHRKGATRAFPAGHPELPGKHKEIGQPVIIPGDMGRYSYLLVGTETAMRETFGTTVHGAGRVLSRKKAIKVAHGRDIRAELKGKGIIVRAREPHLLAEEMSDAYKDVADVVDVVEKAGISLKVAKLVPVGVIKG